jgi:transcriptional adapter 3
LCGEVTDFQKKKAAKTMGADKHKPSTTLDDIITELKLTYDESLGILDGDAIRETPNFNTLTNLSKLLSNLARELKEVEASDDEILKNINTILGTEDEPPTADSGVQEAEDEADDRPISSNKRRKLNDIDVEEQEDNTTGTEDFVPAPQSGSFTQDNDTRLKNPKSEFVKSQTLSKDAVAELGLFSEDHNSLETHGKEYLKKKYGVSSYPENDLMDLLPGTIPDTDFSKTKAPNNQVQFTTFQTYTESYFRPFSNLDVELLQEKNIIPPGFSKDYDPDVTPFIIPKLGAFYGDVWAEEDATLGSKLNSPTSHQQSLESYKPKGSSDEITDNTLYTEEVSVGPLSSRLLSAIFSNHEVNSNDEDMPLKELNVYSDEISEVNDGDKLDGEVASQLNSSEDYKVTSEISDFNSLEERLKQELKYIGIFMNLPTDDERKFLKNGRLLKKGSIIDNEDWIKNREDDEICAEMRELQKELKAAVAKNREHRRALIPIVEEQIAYQEYCTILEDLDKQVDQAYIKRLKSKNKKKKTDTNVTTPQQEAVNSGLRALLEKRTRWIENIGKLFKLPEIMKRVPEVSVFDKAKEESAEDDQNSDQISTTTDLIMLK